MAQMPTASCSSVSSVEFAPNLADSGRLFRGTFSPDGRMLYYFRKVTPGKEDYRIYTSAKQGTEWSAPIRLDLGGVYSDLYPSVSPDGKRLVFVSYRLAPGDTTKEPNGYLWYAGWKGNGWGPPVFIATANEFGTYHSGPIIDADYAIHFHRTSADWRRKWSLVSRWNGKGYDPPTPDGDEAVLAQWKDWRGGKYHIWGATMPRPGLLLIEMSEKNEAGRPKPSELWFSRKSGATWSEPRQAGGGVNTAATENFFSPSPDGCSVLFVRNFSEFYLVGLDALTKG